MAAEAETLSAGIAGATPPTPTKSDAELLGTRPKTTPFSSTSNPIPGERIYMWAELSAFLMNL